MIDLRCCDVADVLTEARGARLVHADPPWVYGNRSPRGDGSLANVSEHYDTLSIADIAEHIRESARCALPTARLMLWSTWPQLGDWMAQDVRPWRYVTGGAWAKDDRLGQGHHWRGMSEPVLVYVHDGGATVNRAISNTHISQRGQHSEKPEGWLAEALRAWTDPGDLVLDLYAGLAPMARACAATGRAYLGAEIDAERYRHAKAKLKGAPYHPNPAQCSMFGGAHGSA